MQTRLLTLSLAGSLLAFASCQRAPYAAFQQPSTQPIERVQTVQNQVPASELVAVQPGAPVVVAPVPEAQASAVSAPVETNARTVTWSETTTTAPAKAVAVKKVKQPSKFVTKLVAKRIAKIQKKFPAQAAGSASNADTMALLALIFGGVGLLFVFAVSLTLGFLFGVAGLVLGIVSMKNASSSGRTLALVGLILGGLAALVGLLYLL